MTSQNASELYKRLSHRDHILELPDTYIGSTETHQESRWIYDSEHQKMTYQTVAFNPGFYKLFDEVIVNARDALVRSQQEKSRQPVKHIDVTVEKLSDTTIRITVENDGDGIPVQQHVEEKCYIPELIFGHLLTSSNYKKEVVEEKVVGGKNGYGAKLANIFSNRFRIETRDVHEGLKYAQEWTDHMSKCSKPSVQKDKSQKGFTRITFEPDTARFAGLDLDTMIRVLHTRTLEIAALAGKEVKVSWNGSSLATNTFEKYTQLFLRDEASLAYERCGERWEVAAVLTRSLFGDDETPDERHVSFVNGIHTKKGGKHVETVIKHILGDFCELAKKKKVEIKPSQLKDTVLFFVNATIVNPSFESQTKECLTTPANKFGSQFKTSGKLVDTLVKMGLLEEAQNILDAKAAKESKKTDGAKKKTIRGIPKLEDALWAGTAKSAECTLILTEGDSAATSAISGLKVVGREKWGVFPLKGKILNVKDISELKLNQNEEFVNLKKIVGLEKGKKYKNRGETRYGRIMIMADQDNDGTHIKGLLMNLFHTEWPELLKMGFLCSLATPLLKATRRNDTRSFYNQAEFDSWAAAQGTQGAQGWKLKYYKGLGTSTPAEAREWFEELHEIYYAWDPTADESISLAFSKKRSDDRKKWLATYDPKRMAKANGEGQIPYSSFVHDELIHFSNADNLRSLPHLMDGLKPSQRKIVFGCLKRGLRQEIRVAQLAGYVSEHAAYHHGEASLNSTIIGMAQTFVGSNNINLLVPIGQFGSRLLGGKDSASPRYIHTHLEPIVDNLIRKEDAAILKVIEDDGLKVEPEYYLPTVPLLAINGSIGIGTGFSTDIPPHNPSDIVQLLKERIHGRKITLAGYRLKPWWYGFKGPVLASGEDAWITKGLYTLDDAKCTVTITELPVGTWTKDYKVFLDTFAGAEGAVGENGKPILKSFDDLYDDDTVRFVLYMEADYYEDIKADTAEFEKRFKLTSLWRTSNMTCFNMDMKIVKYACIGDMLEAYFGPRLAAYEDRRQSEMARLEYDMRECDAKARFLKAVLDGTLELRKASDEDIVKAMQAHNLPPLSDPEFPDVVDAYEYLLRLRMDRVKASAIEEAEKQLMAARMAFETLRDTTASELWLRDLEAFESAWESMKMNREAASSSSGKSTKKRATVRKPKA